MKKKILLLLLVFSFTIIMSFYLRSKVVFTTFDERISQTSYVKLDDMCLGFSKEKQKLEYQSEYTSVSSLNELIEKSDFIAKVHYKSRKQNISIVETCVDVKEVYKGNIISSAIIYEPIYAVDYYDFLETYSSTHMLSDDYDYIVFLQNALPDNQNYFNYINTLCSLYPIKDEISIKQINYIEDDDTPTITMNEYNNYDNFYINYINIEEMYTQENLNDYDNQWNVYKNIVKDVYKKYLNQDIALKYS